MSLSCKYDEKYIYFRVHKDDFHFGNETLYVPIDTTPKSGSTACDGIAPLFEQEADFCTDYFGAGGYQNSCTGKI